MSKDIKYFNFPIQMLDGFMEDSRSVLSRIAWYSMYAYSVNNGCTFEKAAKYFTEIPHNLSHAERIGKDEYDRFPGNSPRAGLSIEMFRDFNRNEKSDFEKACFLAFLALKSILQKDQKAPFKKIDNRYLLARMDGKTHSCDYYELSPEVHKYANRYQLTRIKTELEMNWGLKAYSHYTGGFYVSFDLPLEELIYRAEKRRKSFLEKQFREEKSEARKRAMERTPFAKK